MRANRTDDLILVKDEVGLEEQLANEALERSRMRVVSVTDRKVLGHATGDEAVLVRGLLARPPINNRSFRRSRLRSTGLFAGLGLGAAGQRPETARLHRALARAGKKWPEFESGRAGLETRACVPGALAAFPSWPLWCRAA